MYNKNIVFEYDMTNSAPIDIYMELDNSFNYDKRIE